MGLSVSKNPVLRDKKVLILERAPEPKVPNPIEHEEARPYANRTVALNPKTLAFMEKTGAWDHIGRWGTIKQLHVYDSRMADSVISFNRDDPQLDVARVVENDMVANSFKSALDNSRVEFKYNASVDKLTLPATSGAEMAKLELSDGELITTNLVIGSDGAQSIVRKAMTNNRNIQWDYDQSAIVANVEFGGSGLEPGDNQVAWQRFLSTGPIALLPLAANRSNLIWSTTKSEAKRLLNYSEEEFADKINEAFIAPKEERNNQLADSILGMWRQVLGAGSPTQLPPRVIKIQSGTRASFPLAVAHSVHYVGPRCALIGDAAHRIHPMAGQGVNLGFGDVLSLTEALANGAKNGADIGTSAILYPFESERQRENLARMVVVDALYRLYRVSALPVVLVRAMGVHLTDTFSPLKSWIVDQTCH
jgi:ubiquinone biosynthesis monooxygenase Coq6